MSNQSVPTPTGDLLGRVNRSRALVLARLSSVRQAPAERAILNLLQRQDVDGSWGSADYPPWRDVLTSFTLQILLSADFSQEATWTIDSPIGLPRRGGVARGFEFLCRDRSQPGWGEDFHDTCQALIAMCMLRDRSTVARTLEDGFTYLLAELDTDLAGQRSGDWFGPAFYASALDALTLYDIEPARCELLAERIATMQHPEGYFGTPDLSQDLLIYHTSVCILSLAARGVPTVTADTERALAWLRGVQDPATGAWGTGLARLKAIFTGYAVSALAAFRSAEDPTVDAGVAWLTRQQVADGSIAGVEGTVMAVRALTSASAQGSSPALVRELIEIDDVLQETCTAVVGFAQQADEARGRAADAEQALATDRERYFFVLTHRRANQIGFVIGVAGLIAAVLALMPFVIHSTNGGTPRPATSASR